MYMYVMYIRLCNYIDTKKHASTKLAEIETGGNFIHTESSFNT